MQKQVALAITSFFFLASILPSLPIFSLFRLLLEAGADGHLEERGDGARPQAHDALVGDDEVNSPQRGFEGAASLGCASSPHRRVGTDASLARPLPPAVVACTGLFPGASRQCRPSAPFRISANQPLCRLSSPHAASSSSSVLPQTLPSSTLLSYLETNPCSFFLQIPCLANGAKNDMLTPSLIISTKPGYQGSKINAYGIAPHQ